MRTDWEHLRMVSASAISPVLAYYTPTKGFLLALVLAFAFNIYAGMKADGVSFTCCENFSFSKFKNALAELRNGQRDLGFAITQGFSSTAFQAQQDKCDILRAGQDNTQRIIDTLNNHWKDEQALKIQDLKFELSQERQNSLINERFNRLGNCGCGGNSCGCGCGQ